MISHVMTVARPDRISVCVCTFKRPEMLARLLDAVAGQVRDPLFSFDVVVVDNDGQRSSEEVVRHARRRAGIDVIYDCEVVQNISLARNRAIRNATGNLVAFLDDDEYPVEDWLVRLYRTLKTHGADGVLGPVVPHFPPGAPGWLKRGKFLDRRRLSSGTRITARDGRTGNVLLLRSIFTETMGWFDPAFGKTGGEDSAFFRRQLDNKRVFIWCDEAVAYESVPPERWHASFYVRKYLRSGTVDGELMRTGELHWGAVAKNLFILFGCLAVAPFSLGVPKHLRVRIIQKLAYCGGVVTAFAGFSVLRDRDEARQP
jgi:succinoglycan biosynthesis protein ExoM